MGKMASNEIKLTPRQRVKKWMIEKGWIKLSIHDWQTLYSFEEQKLFMKDTLENVKAFFKRMDAELNELINKQIMEK